MGESKKRFRVVGVSNEQNIERYAEEVERVMNDLIEQGYSVALRGESEGLLVVGEMQGPPQDVIDRVKEYMRRVGVAVVQNPRTAELLTRFEDATSRRTEDVERNAINCTKGFSHEELETASREIMEIAETHKSHKCDDGQFYRAVATALKQAALQTLQ